MSTGRKRKLEMTITAIQKRWGLKAIGRGTKQELSATPHIPTSFPELDNALGIGGIPRGRISEIIGIPTSGMATMALKIIASAQTKDSAAVYLDLEQTFDPAYAHRCGVNLNDLVLVHPDNLSQALAMAADFIINAIPGELDILVFDIPLRFQKEPGAMQSLSTTIGRLISPLSRAGSALIFLTTLPPASSPTLDDYPSHASLPHYAATRLFIQKERWLYARRDVSGYEAQVIIIKNKFAGAGKTVRIAITFNGVVAGDSA